MHGEIKILDSEGAHHFGEKRQAADGTIGKKHKVPPKYSQ